MPTKQRIEQLAQALLTDAGIVVPPVPLDRIASHKGLAIRYVPFDGDISGLLYKDHEQIIVGVNATHPTTRQRFTIAHELGHLELHHLDQLHIDRPSGPVVVLRSEKSSQAIDPHEIEANAFAAALLIPVSMLRSDIKDERIDLEDDERIKGLANRYKVSLQAMVFRLTNIGHLEQRK